MEITVECQKRAEGSKPRALRREGLIPASLYGHKGTESMMLTVKAKTLEKLLKQAGVNSTVVDLNIPDLSWRGKTLLREVQIHPVKRWAYHVSFFALSEQASVEVEVPVHFVGEAPGVKVEGGVLDLVLMQLEIKCAPDNIPDAIEVDISGLHLKDILYVSELVLPAGIVVVGDPGRAVASVMQSTVSAEAEAIIEEAVAESGSSAPTPSV
ncbi:50S ribosomal protein L25/general stress protein Ctc [Chlorogloea sp. CCALA 695]|jgi:large subunit ribosomal protein L25|uniref:50S ribosomal protein L25/general stress protein Ctc n=1 Tax=Chlorogloea sp. CCALA 695 TaxID=2107693 RepID=UPI000D06F7FF|nr:50S ribosomal protein L25/general stress protein Ctc [Chlorogloea sp. CCALA 695]PSB35413.1 50S ribosomal protein L25 [Chlorogloea sp. CCALA 695]